MEASPQWRDGQFRNPEGAAMQMDPRTMWAFVAGGSPHRKPSTSIPTVNPAEALRQRAEGVRVTWLGHGSSLIEIEGVTVLVDPVWGEFASPNRIAGVRRFFAPPLALDDLPSLDAVLLTHDHYDHLCAPTVARLAERVGAWIVPLGVGARLEGWGVPPEHIREFDWWEETALGGVRVVATPARHFSGRGLRDRNTTLWCGWALLGETHRVLAGGDGGYSAAFRQIGERLGPFDVALMEIGAYHRTWADIHMGPEQAVRAAQDVGARLLIPVHWATFDLALHGWTEPGERIVRAAEAARQPLAVPRPGEPVDPAAPPDVERWWPDLEWESAEAAPIVASGAGGE
ncbi:MAG TPA: MBL fold metallo-hydrolase [Bacteroidetes bacterium]|nr:MBL fold metallo-hydrolase [Bacteroidota bacterium]HIL58776.1 MBL fold metallo-hydrolase [Rhodothermales bacterium]